LIKCFIRFIENKENIMCLVNENVYENEEKAKCGILALFKYLKNKNYNNFLLKNLIKSKPHGKLF
jgi:hypothetical protein